MTMSAGENRKFRTIDLRATIARGEEPRAKLFATVAALRADEGLIVVTPFLPSPLIERLRMDGFTARPERAGDGSWRTTFVRE